MTKAFSSTLVNVFSGRKSEPRSAQAIKSQIRPIRKQAVQPFWKYAAFALIALNMAVLFSYLFGINTAASSGYEIKKLQQQVAAQNEESKRLNLKISEQASIAELQVDFANSGYIPVGQVVYLATGHLSQK